MAEYTDEEKEFVQYMLAYFESDGSEEESPEDSD
jgi:hypothetical protein